MEIEIRPNACVGAGQCALVAADVFDQDDDGMVLVLDDHPPAELHAVVHRAASLCPARAISVRD